MNTSLWSNFVGRCGPAQFRRARAGILTVNDRPKTGPARGRSPGVDPGRFGSWQTALDFASMEDHSWAAGWPIFQILPPRDLPVGRVRRASDRSVARRHCRAPDGQVSSHLTAKHLISTTTARRIDGNIGTSGLSKEKSDSFEPGKNLDLHDERELRDRELDFIACGRRGLHRIGWANESWARGIPNAKNPPSPATP